tara:strand:+ start:571 stop:780 length:210 start_codon:yes stop_codon:yes gene_type:complete
MKVFFLLINLIDSSEKIRIGKPKIEGMYEVKELLELIKLIIIPHIIKNDPYKTEKNSIDIPKILNCVIF